jgi:ferredoxin--NADP+ reductase
MTEERTLRVAVVGSGPAGFYAAERLLAGPLPAEVDVIERLPTPWGLVRLGVAPDHAHIKVAARGFERIAAQPGFRFFGNVAVGRDLSHEELLRLYDAVVYAVGAQTDRRLGIPGEDLPGSWPATAFVAWYNGHPDFQRLGFDLSCERAVVVGAGNVALDVVRMLALSPEEIRATDTTEAAIETILGSALEEIVLVARRGPVQAAFTAPELKEIGDLAGADVVVDPAELELDPASEAALAADANARRNLELLRRYAERRPGTRRRTIRLRFRLSPVAILGAERVEGIELVRNELEADESGQIRAVPTAERETIACGAVFRSVGYTGVALPGVPFDESTGTIPNRRGRVLDERGGTLPRVYCAGWIKRGAIGVIGTNKKDARETIDLLFEDAAAGLLECGDPEAGAETVLRLLEGRGVELVEYAGWQAIDAEERVRGRLRGSERVKLSSWDELLSVARSVAKRRD